MEFENYLQLFQKAADKLDKTTLNKKQVEVGVGVVLNSVFLKLYKKSWANPGDNPLTGETRIFFSIWANDSTLQDNKIYYNIHAFKLRKLKGYSIESKKFADSFRTKFKPFEHKWKNVRVNFGPLTLMEGSINLDLKNLQNEILELANNFFEIEDLIDKTLTEFKK